MIASILWAATVLAAALFLFLTCRVYIYDWLFHRKLPPGPTPIPIIGNLLTIVRLVRKGIDKQHMFMSAIAEKWGDIFTIYLGQIRMVSIRDADLLHEAIVEKGYSFLNRPSGVAKMNELMNFGILHANGDAWRIRRRFAMRSMRDFGMGKAGIVENIHDEVGFLLQEIEDRCDKPFVPHTLILNATSNIVCQMAFGKRFDYADPFYVELLKRLNTFFATPVGADDAALFFFPFLRKFSKSSKMTRELDSFDEFSIENVANAIEDHRKTFNPDHIRDFPDLFIENEGKEDALTLKEYASLMRDLFFAGTDTTAITLNWTLIWLCKHPEIQHRCVEEIEKVMGSSSRLPTLEDKAQLTYIEAIMHEVLRHPTISPTGIMHATNEDVTLGGGRYEIPKDTTIYINIGYVHHDPSYWHEPDRFNPDRWLDKNGKMINHGRHFIPFGAGGPRVCLGEALSRVEYFITLVALLQRFKFSFPKGEDVNIDDATLGHTLNPPHYNLIATRRN